MSFGNINVTLDKDLLYNSANQITETCFNWCKEQHYVNDFGGVWLIGLSLLVLVFFHVIHTFPDFIQQTFEVSEQKLEWLLPLLVSLSTYLLIGFFIWFLYLK